MMVWEGSESKESGMWQQVGKNVCTKSSSNDRLIPLVYLPGVGTPLTNIRQRLGTLKQEIQQQ